MTSFELALIQAAFLVILAPLCAGLVTTVRTLVKEKTWVTPWVMYRRENSVIAAVAMGVTVAFGSLLPLMSLEALAGSDGNTFVLIALLALIGAMMLVVNATSVIPMALSAIGAAFLALAVATSSINGSDILLATSGDGRPSIVLVAIAIGLVLIALWNDAPSSRTQDVRTLLNVILGVFLVNLVAMIAVGNQLTSTVPAINIAILAGKAIGATFIIGVLAARVKRYASITPRRLIRVAMFLNILSIIVTLWRPIA